MDISPQALREHLKQTMREATDAVPRKASPRKLKNWTSDGLTKYDPSNEDKPYTLARERHWRSIGKKVAKLSRIR